MPGGGAEQRLRPAAREPGAAARPGSSGRGPASGGAGRQSHGLPHGAPHYRPPTIQGPLLSFDSLTSGVRGGVVVRRGGRGCGRYDDYSGGPSGVRGRSGAGAGPMGVPRPPPALPPAALPARLCVVIVLHFFTVTHVTVRFAVILGGGGGGGGCKAATGGAGEAATAGDPWPALLLVGGGADQGRARALPAHGRAPVREELPRPEHRRFLAEGRSAAHALGVDSRRSARALTCRRQAAPRRAAAKQQHRWWR